MVLFWSIYFVSLLLCVLAEMSLEDYWGYYKQWKPVSKGEMSAIGFVPVLNFCLVLFILVCLAIPKGYRFSDKAREHLKTSAYFLPLLSLGLLYFI